MSRKVDSVRNSEQKTAKILWNFAVVYIFV